MLDKDWDYWRKCTLEDVKRDVENGGNINYCDRDGNNLLHLLSYRYDGVTEIITYLISKGMDVNKTNNDGKTALIMACERGSVKTVRCLLENKADPNIRDREDYSAFHYVAYHSDVKLGEELVKYKADPTSLNRFGENSFRLAIRNRNLKMAEFIYFLDNIQIDINQRDNGGNTYLHDAASIIVESSAGRYKYGDIKIMNFLLKEGIDPEVINENGDTALDIVKKSKIKNQYGTIVLAKSMNEKREKREKMLLELSAKFLKNEASDESLHYAP